MSKRRPHSRPATVDHTGVRVVYSDADSVFVVDNRQPPDVAITDDVIHPDRLPSPTQLAVVVDWYRTHVGSIRRQR